MFENLSKSEYFFILLRSVERCHLASALIAATLIIFICFLIRLAITMSQDKYEGR